MLQRVLFIRWQWPVNAVSLLVLSYLGLLGRKWCESTYKNADRMLQKELERDLESSLRLFRKNSKAKRRGIPEVVRNSSSFS